MKLRELDVVRTRFGTIAVVSEVNSVGKVSLVLPRNSTQHVAWYAPSELEFIASVKDMHATYENSLIRQAGNY